MGMATPIPTKSCKWVKGEYTGTSMQYTPLMVIPEDCCPVCLKPRNEKNSGENNGAM